MQFSIIILLGIGHLLVNYRQNRVFHKIMVISVVIVMYCVHLVICFIFIFIPTCMGTFCHPRLCIIDCRYHP